MNLNPQERKRLLAKRAKRILEASGFGLKKTQDGKYYVLDGETEELLAEFEDIESLGIAFNLWSPSNNGLFERDKETGLDTPELAAVRERV